MRRQLTLWGTRALSVAIVVVAVQHWGSPLYRQFVAPKKATPYVATAKVSGGRFVISFHEIGALEAEKSMMVSSEIDGKIIKLISEGAVVAAGDVIAILDTTNVRNEVLSRKLKNSQDRAEVGRAKAKLNILIEQNKTVIAQSQAELDFNKSEYERAQKSFEKKKRLADEKLIPRDQVDQAEIDVRSKELAVRKGEMQLDLKKKEVQSEEEQKRADVANAESVAGMSKLDLDNWQNNLKKAIIKAPSAGMVVLTSTWVGGSERRKLKEGDGVWPRMSICQLPELSSMLVKVQVGESDAPRVKLGMKCLVRLEAVPSRTFHGVVKEISSLASEKMFWETGAEPGKKNFEVTIDLEEADPRTLKPGMTADLEFIEKTLDKAVYAPIEAVQERSGKTFAFVRNGKRYQRVLVQTGPQNDNSVVITKGLKKGDVVCLRDPTRPMDQQESGAANVEEGKGEKAVPIPEKNGAKK
ncbi:MAG: efflux RND transporter periplasmic adaptor subunit [Armatimonadota bacterium]|nr:efflux RND transporter periplasmic adaptor subunit [Armatimonadota bacterium]